MGPSDLSAAATDPDTETAYVLPSIPPCHQRSAPRFFLSTTPHPAATVSTEHHSSSCRLRLPSKPSNTKKTIHSECSDESPNQTYPRALPLWLLLSAMSGHPCEIAAATTCCQSATTTSATTPRPTDDRPTSRSPPPAAALPLDSRDLPLLQQGRLPFAPREHHVHVFGLVEWRCSSRS